MRAPALLLPPFLLLAGCAETPPNRLADAGFEDGSSDWFWLEASAGWLHAFERSGLAHSGQRSLLTSLDSSGDARRVGIVGAVQNLTASELGGRIPTRLAGHYRVERWEPGTPVTYLQVVLTAWPREDAARPLCPFGPGASPRTPCQVAYPLAGIEREPFRIDNRKFVFLGTGAPPRGAWVAFETDPRADFAHAWGGEPRGFSHLWLYLEARYEYPAEGARAPVRIEAHWDDLWLG